MITLNKIANKKAFLGRVLDEYQIKKKLNKITGFFIA